VFDALLAVNGTKEKEGQWCRSRRRRLVVAVVALPWRWDDQQEA
jgi:hypothetical protein